MNQQPRYRLAIFDFDGTLIDSFGWFVGALDQLADRHRFRRIAPDAVESLRGQDARAVIRRLDVAWWRLPAIARDCRRMAADDLHTMQLFDGIATMLGTLAASGLILAVVSTNSEGNVRRALGPVADCIPHFDCGGGLFRKRAGIRRILRRAGVGRDQAIYIGDEVRDYQAATAAGIAFGAASWGFNRRDALEAVNPAVVFHTVADITHYLLGTASA